MKSTPKPSDAVAMHSETPQILQKKPGEPGGEKARVAKELFDSLSDHAPIPTVLLNQEQFTRAVAGALAACALEAQETERAKHLSVEEIVQSINVAKLAEAKWWAGGYHDSVQHADRQACDKCARIAALERAAEGESLGKPEVRGT